MKRAGGEGQVSVPKRGQHLSFPFHALCLFQFCDKCHKLTEPLVNNREGVLYFFWKMAAEIVRHELTTRNVLSKANCC